MKTIEMFSRLPLINNSATVRLNFVLLKISVMIQSKAIDILRFLFGLYSSMFL